jgi:S-adenosylmethionine:tRNA ribosyltransferase-isomerase
VSALASPTRVLAGAVGAPACPGTGEAGAFLADARNATPIAKDTASLGLDFDLPREVEADRPPEARGLARDQVRMMVATRGGGRIEHARFRDLPELLAPGDLLVVNASATLPAAAIARRAEGGPVELRFSTAAPPNIDGGEWAVELRSADGARRFGGEVAAGERLSLPAGARVELLAPYMGSTRLWLARFEAGEPLHAYLFRHGHPIRYGHVRDEWPLEAYQTVFARNPGSAEMPSAARPFSAELVTSLVAGGIHIAPLTLHGGVSSPERREPPYPERYVVPEPTARLVNGARESGARVIAVGTTVARAIETVAGPGRKVTAGEGWTDLVVTPERGLRAVDGLLTGWHEPRASHLALLEAAAGRGLLERSYEAALEHGYLWHEFGDSHLILPARSR